ncbi:hypothetical protein ML067_002422 [Klebsiella pneumoniae]|uniref:hypothetical protein n=1 Tax=Klebsiella pneumoniae complex TaxID=3390273 RepID=UPI000808DDF6|nr:MULTISPECIES: hypothetical protein [Klebsiella]HDT4129789.1 hypothetical protein [Klebsiella pneumoniae subsp. pneumoniae]EIX9575927.1 hypothetical protein [Klebsiella pneumoniae]MBC4928306.1 hypothetical protein [Klebsiella quasipneumoniae]MBC5410099.1 hypothetical protein [Klebsiella pneumoniae]MBP3989468.1 hypothetical protein [Klebsiella pneumoniae]
MLSDYERWVFVYDLIIKPKHPSAPDITMKDALGRLKLLFDAGKAVKMYFNESRALRLSDLQINNYSKKASLLIQMCDKNASDPVFSELKSGSLRVEPKLDGEGIAVSAHIVLSMLPNKGSTNSHLMLAEEVPGIGRTALQSFLQALMKEAFEGQEFKNPNTKRMCEQRPMLQISSHQSKSLQESLKGGKLLTVTLTSNKKINAFDQNPYTKQVDHVVKLKVVKQPKTLGDKVNFVDQMRNKAHSEGFDNFKVTFRNHEKQDSLEFERNDDATTKLFTRSEKVSLGEPIKQCEAQIHTNFHEKLLTLMKRI